MGIPMQCKHVYYKNLELVPLCNNGGMSMGFRLVQIPIQWASQCKHVYYKNLELVPLYNNGECPWASGQSNVIQMVLGGLSKLFLEKRLPPSPLMSCHELRKVDSNAYAM